MFDKPHGKTSSREKLLVPLQAFAIFALVYFTNHGFGDRIESLYSKEKWLVLGVFAAVWGLSLVCLFIAAQQPNRVVRLFWAIVISLTTALAHSFYIASGADLNVFYVLSLWTARHETARALEFYQEAGVWALIVLCISTAVYYLPPAIQNSSFQRTMRRLAWAPLLPVVFMVAILVARNGSGSQAMPRQFQPMALGAVAAARILSDKTQERKTVDWQTTSTPQIRKIVLLVDESVRPDYLDWGDGNIFTPTLAANKERFINFGPAASGGNCSSYSNAILRLGATRKHFVESVKSNPTIWQFAKRAGFRTVYIDAQSSFIKSDKKIQNFMTFEELRKVDRFVTFDQLPAPQLDFKLLSVVAEELGKDEPVLIYANKNGAHFPYDAGYPESEKVFEPSTEDTNDSKLLKKIAAYRNVLRWNVDKFFGDLLATLDLTDTVIIYTSDHGQHFASGKLTHCTVENPDVRQGLVPLLALTQNKPLADRLKKAAQLNHARISHFAITPAVLQLMGFDPAAVASDFGPSLFEAQTVKPAFTSEYIFGLFKSDVTWTPIDLEANYLEPFALLNKQAE